MYADKAYGSKYQNILKKMPLYTTNEKLLAKENTDAVLNTNLFLAKWALSLVFFTFILVNIY